MDKIFFSVVLFFCVAFKQDVFCKKHNHHKSSGGHKIVGGYDVDITSVPYQAYLLLRQGNLYYQCGGSLISTKYILTAAHCLTGITRVYARIGSTNSDDGGTMYSTYMYTIHPQYNSRANDYDVAVVYFPRGMKLDGTNSRTIKLADEGTSIPEGTEILVTGWGATSEGGNTSSTLLAVKVPSISNEDCQKSYGNSITARMFCAGEPEGGKDSCQGDSGGPAVANDLQVGIVSFGYGCAREGYPGVYSNVSSLRSWIRKNTGV